MPSAASRRRPICRMHQGSRRRHGEDPAISAIYPARRHAADSRATASCRRDYAETLATIARTGRAALHDGALGEAPSPTSQGPAAILTATDLRGYRPWSARRCAAAIAAWRSCCRRRPLLRRACAADAEHPGGLRHRRAGLRHGGRRSHLLAEVLKIAFADRAAATGDPAFVTCRSSGSSSKAYADERRAPHRPRRARSLGRRRRARQSPNTTHMTVADGDGHIVCATQTINSLFGARFMVPRHRA